MPRLALTLSAALAAALLASVAGCSTTVPLGQQGAPCDFDEQCDPAKGLSCACVRRRSPDEEGPDQIVAHGFCGRTGTVCPTDGGVDAPVSADTGSDATTDSGSDTATDAPLDSSTGADAASSG